MTKEEWLSSPKTIEKSRKPYAHFDYRCDISSCATYITDPEKISTHSFYPFIHYKKDMSKYSSKSGLKPKSRDICYASHIDSCIFQYYGFLLNELYIQRIKADGIFDVPIAYRSDLHKNNIFFSKKAFDFIKANNQCHIMIGDISAHIKKPNGDADEILDQNKIEKVPRCIHTRTEYELFNYMNNTENALPRSSVSLVIRTGMYLRNGIKNMPMRGT